MLSRACNIVEICWHLTLTRFFKLQSPSYGTKSIFDDNVAVKMDSKHGTRSASTSGPLKSRTCTESTVGAASNSYQLNNESTVTMRPSRPPISQHPPGTQHAEASPQHDPSGSTTHRVISYHVDPESIRLDKTLRPSLAFENGPVLWGARSVLIREVTKENEQIRHLIDRGRMWMTCVFLNRYSDDQAIHPTRSGV